MNLWEVIIYWKLVIKIKELPFKSKVNKIHTYQICKLKDYYKNMIE